jgi:hypothetical protein
MQVVTGSKIRRVQWERKGVCHHLLRKGMNRMARSEVVNLVAGEVTITGYGRRTIEEEAGREGW